MATAADSSGAQQRILVPTAFCRECGQDYLAVTRSDTETGRRYAARRDNDASGGDEASGYLFISDDQPWPPSLEQVLVDGRLPYSWLTYDPVAGQTVDPARVKLLPEPIRSTSQAARQDPVRAPMRPTCRAPSGSACAAAPPTSRLAATTLPSWPSCRQRAAAQPCR